jgi:hypothetical protein
MNIEDTQTGEGSQEKIKSPHQWPDALYLEGQREEVDSSLQACLAGCDRMLGIFIDLTAQGVSMLKRVLAAKERYSGTFIVALSPACPTRESDLHQLLHLQDEFQGEDRQLQLRLLPLPSGVTEKARHSVSPPSSLLLQNSKTGQSWLWLGSNGDLDEYRPYHTGSLNLLLPVSATVVGQWCRHFDYVTVKAAPLKADGLRIPELVPARGEVEAADQWASFCKSLYECSERDRTAKVEIDRETGEVKAETLDEQPVQTASEFNSIEHLPKELQEILPVFERGSLVSVDEATRIKPLTVPVKSFLFDQDSENTVGAVKRKQSFTLELLDKDLTRALERCRKINDTVTLLSFSLGTSMHWIPDAAKPLLECELDAMETQAKKLLKDTLGGGIEEWIEKRWTRFARDLKKMYQELHNGEGEPDEDRMQRVRQEVKDRLTKAMEGRLVPKITYSAFMPHVSLQDEGAVSGLGKVLQLLKSSALQMREPYHNNFFERNFTKRKLELKEWRAAMNIFNDTAHERFKQVHYEVPKQEKAEIESIFGDSGLTEREKLTQLWNVIRRPVDKTAS